MDDLAAIVDDLIYRKPSEPPSEREMEVRGKLVTGLFVYYKQTDPADDMNLRLYVTETTEIPFDKFALGIKAIMRSRVWPDLPKIADLWRAAREIAGMNKDQYNAGHYIPAPKQWPPAGQRHGDHAREFEALPSGELEAIGPGVATGYLPVEVVDLAEFEGER